MTNTTEKFFVYFICLRANIFYGNKFCDMVYVGVVIGKLYYKYIK